MLLGIAEQPPKKKVSVCLLCVLILFGIADTDIVFISRKFREGELKIDKFGNDHCLQNFSAGLESRYWCITA